MVSTDQILLLANRYGAALGIPDVTISSRVFGDSKKLGALRNGAGLTIRRFNGAVHWFSDNWPENANWPSDVQRPASMERAS